MNRKIRIKFNWEIGGWEDNKTVVPVITSFFIGDYSGYLKESVKYFFGEKKIQLNFNYKNYLYNVLFDGGYDSYFLIIPPLKKCIEEVEKIKPGVSENFFLEMGEGFGAEIRKEAVLLYFLYDYEMFRVYVRVEDKKVLIFAEDELDFQWSEKHISDYFLALYCKHKLNIKVKREEVTLYG